MASFCTELIVSLESYLRVVGTYHFLRKGCVQEKKLKNPTGTLKHVQKALNIVCKIVHSVFCLLLYDPGELPFIHFKVSVIITQLDTLQTQSIRIVTTESITVFLSLDLHESESKENLNTQKKMTMIFDSVQHFSTVILDQPALPRNSMGFFLFHK